MTTKSIDIARAFNYIFQFSLHQNVSDISEIPTKNKGGIFCID